MIDRRRWLAGGAAALVTAHARPVMAERFAPGEPLKRGQFRWQPELAPAGPVVLIVSLPEQLVHVYRGGIEIGVSTCSTGKPGHRTPTGVFTILEKQREHVSSIYKGAQMPNMERLTWGGIALHAGNLPGFPASHGCIRLPMTFSSLLFGVTHLGVVVIIADERTQPVTVAHPGVLLPAAAEVEARAFVQRIARKSVPAGWQTDVEYPMTSIVVSRADGMAYVMRDGKLAASHPARIEHVSQPLGTHAYSLVGPSADGSALLWLAFGIGKSRRDAHIVSWKGDTALRRISFHDLRHARDIADGLHPGSTLLLTDASAPRTTRGTSKEFAVIASEPDV